MTANEALFQAVVDRLAIEDLIVQYAKGRDTTDPAIYKAIFAPDASIGIPGGRTLSGDLEAILEKVATDRIRFNPGCEDGKVSWAKMRHVVTNIEIVLDGERASSSYYVMTLAQNEAAKKPEIIATALNEDEYEKRDGRWWIVRSTLNFGWENEEMGRALQVGPYTPVEFRR